MKKKLFFSEFSGIVNDFYVEYDRIILDGFELEKIPLQSYQKQQQQQVAKEEKPHIDTKSYLDSDIGSIFLNGEFKGLK